jgi:hypothetical protein
LKSASSRPLSVTVCTFSKVEPEEKPETIEIQAVSPKVDELKVEEEPIVAEDFVSFNVSTTDGVNFLISATFAFTTLKSASSRPLSKPETIEIQAVSPKVDELKVEEEPIVAEDGGMKEAVRFSFFFHCI